MNRRSLPLPKSMELFSAPHAGSYRRWVWKVVALRLTKSSPEPTSMELSRIAQALVAAPEAKELMTTASLPAPVLMEELLSMPTASALPPRFHHHQPPLLEALVLMEILSSPLPVVMSELSRPFAVAGLPPRFHHHQPPPLARALALMLTTLSPDPASMLEFSTAVALEMPPLEDAVTERRSFPEPRSTSELARPFAVAGSFQPSCWRKH